MDWAYWNGAAGEVWAAEADSLDPVLEPLGLAAMDVLAPQPGERILDVGCGAGATTRALAARVGPTGQVVGVDVSGPLLALARARGGADFLHDDAATVTLPPGSFDALFSRFGVMFFDDPPRAFAHLRGALRPGGRLGFICWRSFDENEWARAPLRAAAPLLREPPPPPDPLAPGPFALQDDARVRRILESAGFGSVTATRFDALYLLGPTVEQAVDTVLRIGPLARLVREQALELGPIRAEVAGAFRAALTPRGVEFAAACWLVSARA